MNKLLLILISLISLSMHGMNFKIMSSVEKFETESDKTGRSVIEYKARIVKDNDRSNEPYLIVIQHELRPGSHHPKDKAFLRGAIFPIIAGKVVEEGGEHVPVYTIGILFNVLSSEYLNQGVSTNPSVEPQRFATLAGQTQAIARQKRLEEALKLYAAKQQMAAQRQASNPYDIYSEKPFDLIP